MRKHFKSQEERAERQCETLTILGVYLAWFSLSNGRGAMAWDQHQRLCLWPLPTDGTNLSCSVKYNFISGCGDRTTPQPCHPIQEAWETSCWPETGLKASIPTSCFAMSSLAQSARCWTLSTCPTTEHPTSVSAQHLTSAQKARKAPMKARLTLSRISKWVIQTLHRISSMLWDIWRASWPATHTDYIYG